MNIEENFLELVDIEDINMSEEYVNMVDITVEDDESFTLSNGIISHNSALNELINVRGNLPNVAGIPIRGKLLNVFEKNPIDVVKNEELNNLINAIGLEIGKKPDNMNYGKIGILSDMDQDGNAIAGLLINFFHKFWPQLFDKKQIIRILSPLFTAQKGKIIKRFYTKKDLDAEQLDKTWNLKYMKGLGSLGTEEYENMLTNLEYIEFEIGQNTVSMLELVYSNDVSKRKSWLQEVK